MSPSGIPRLACVPQSPLPFSLTAYLSTELGFDLGVALAARGQFALPPRHFQFAIPFSVDLLPPAFEHGLRGDVADRAVQSLVSFRQACVLDSV
jgi:hypothetical protein